jgi:uncharacterized membrane protein
MLKSISWLIGSLLIAVSSWFYGLDSWQSITPQSFSGLAGAIGGILIAWVGQSPIKPKK